MTCIVAVARLAASGSAVMYFIMNRFLVSKVSKRAWTPALQANKLVERRQRSKGSVRGPAR